MSTGNNEQIDVMKSGRWSRERRARRGALPDRHTKRWQGELWTVQPLCFVMKATMAWRCEECCDWSDNRTLVKYPGTGPNCQASSAFYPWHTCFPFIVTYHWQYYRLCHSPCHHNLFFFVLSFVLLVSPFALNLPAVCPCSCSALGQRVSVFVPASVVACLQLDTCLW